MRHLAWIVWYGEGKGDSGNGLHSLTWGGEEGRCGTWPAQFDLGRLGETAVGAYRGTSLIRNWAGTCWFMAATGTPAGSCGSAESSLSTGKICDSTVAESSFAQNAPAGERCVLSS